MSARQTNVCRKGMLIANELVELSFIFLIALGLLLGFALRSPMLSISIVFLCGMITGTAIYNNRQDHRIAGIILSGAFSTGLIIGNTTVPDIAIIATFAAANLASYFILDKGLIKL